jgi:hypothetical protein
MDAQVIRNIPLSSCRQDDFWAYGTTKDVVYFRLNLLTECLFIDRNQIQDWLDERVESSDTEGAKRRWKLF